MKRRTIALAMILIIGLAAVATAKEDYKKHPGFVDFDRMGVFGDMDASIEVILKGSLLKMVSLGIGEEDPDLSDMIDKLQFIHVQAFPLDEMDIDLVEDKIAEVAKKLEKDGWEVVVRVRDRKEAEQVYIYILPTNSEQIISGLVVMVIGDDDEAVFINVVGDLDPAQIGKLGHTFDIDELDDLDLDEE
jgi:hypothetical protein